jgi:hypothetical protein
MSYDKGTKFPNFLKVEFLNKSFFVVFTSSIICVQLKNNKWHLQDKLQIYMYVSKEHLERTFQYCNI